MASRRDAMRERMKERLNSSQTIPASSTSAAASDADEHHSSINDEDMDDESVESVMKPRADDEAAMMIENIRAQSEQLVTALTNKRKKVKNEVTREAENKMLEEDAPEMLRNAQERMGKKLKAELLSAAAASADAATAEATEAADQMAPSLGILEEDGASSAQPTSRSTLSKSGLTPRKSSISTALRAKLAEKLKAAKDKGKDEAYNETIGRIHKLAGKRTESKTTRFDETGLVKGEDDDEEDEMERSLKMKLRTMSMIQSSMGQKDTKMDLPTEEETYDFFTRVWEKTEDKDADKEESETPVAAAAEDAAEEERQEAREVVERKEDKTGEEEALLKEDALDDECSWLPYLIAGAEYVPTQERLEVERRLFFVPSMFEAPLSQRIFTASSPRHLEDEGFYVGVRPFVPNRNLSRMENRLLREIHGEGGGGGRGVEERDEETGQPDENQNDSHNVRKWFGEDGRLITLPDPVKEISSRPPIVEEIEPALMAKYHEAELPEINALSSGGRYQLDVDVNTVVFSHHHLFSREHIRASELMHLYKEYVSRMKKQIVEYLTGKLCALKSAQRHVEDNIRRIKTDSSKEADTAVTYQEQRLKEYTDEIRLTRKQRDFEMLCDRTLVRNIIRTWKEIKLLRQNQNCTNTPIKLTIKKEETDHAEDEKEWEDDIQEEVLEVLEEVEADYQKRMESYKSQLNLWKMEKLRKKEAKKRRSQRESLQETFEDSEEQRKADEEILTEPSLDKPEKPVLGTSAEARQRIEAKYNEIRRKPGEPRLYLDVTNCTPITNTQQCPREEQQRRNDVSKYKIFIKVLFNNKEVSKTAAKPIGQEFVVRFAQIFNIEIMHWPESITFEIYETSGLTTDLLCTVYAAIPEANLTAVNSQLIEHEFSSEQKRHHSHEGVGSGLSAMQNLDAGKTLVGLTTSGYLSAAVVWAMDSDGSILVPGSETNRNPVYSAMKGADVISAIGLSGLADMSKLTKWVEDSHLDPNDPANADIMHLMRPITEGGGVSTFQLPQHFRLEHVQEEFNFATDEDIENNRRFRLIRLREQEIPGFKNQRIPAVENEIPDELFAAYEKKLKEDEKLKKADDADSHHLAVAKFMQKIREQIMLRFRIATHQKTFADMVYEEAVPNIGIILPSLLKLTEPRRPLKPPRKPRKTVTAQNLQATEVKILVNIVRAVGIPVRSELGIKPPLTSRYQPTSPPTEETMAAVKTTKKADLQGLVRPFVEVMFQQNVLATSVADGPNPSWNEELCIPFRPPQDDYSATNLQTVGDVLYLNLFDEYIVDVNQDERDRGSTIHQRIERRWLGSMQVPFSTIYSNGRIDGTFRIDKPPVLLGYVKESSHITQQMDFGADVVFGDSEHTYLTMFLTIEPQLVSPEPVVEKFDSLESDQLLLMAENWQIELEKRFPKRDYKTTVINFEAKSVFVMRYIKPLNPPEELIKSAERTSLAVAKSVARYVSLIPSVSDSVVFPGLCDIWSTSSQFLQMLQGDEEEHAVLLTNYFLFIGRSAWLVIGSAIPEGPTAYVLTREESDFFLWNARTGEYFSCHDNYCPLQSVGCLVNAENIWGNIQTNDKPSQMSFNLSNTAHWKPLFHKGFPNPGLGSIQADQLSYSTPITANILKLQEKIEGELKKKVSEWRPRYITRWNRLCIQTFRRLLIQLEESHGKGLQYEHFTELDQVLGSYKLCGFPINLPYTEMKSIVDSVYATGVHEYASSDVEFALAVHIQPYPNHVLSVWIYVASLVRLRT